MFFLPSLSKQIKYSSISGSGALLIFILLLCCENKLLFASTNYSMKDFQDMPINIVSEGVVPKVMMATSNDHRLFYAAYNDYTDLDDDGIAEITYEHDIDYYGYFDSYKCYKYNSNKERFVPKEVTEDKYCNDGSTSNRWSGNFLNWVSMSRIDTVRKILFGGHRRIDSAATTILERAYLPHDAHSWAKYYSGDDLPKLTPFSKRDYNCDESNLSSGCQGNKMEMGVTFCNTTDVDMGNYKNKYSEDFFDDPPLIKVVKGNYSLWASNERWQCTWASGASYDNHSTTNANDPSTSGIYAYSSNPAFKESLGEGNYVARVKACVDGLIGEEHCKLYPDGNYKPIGILQTYGDDDEMDFGMVAGSYGKHASGGVLIRNVDSMSDEINVDTDGTFSMVSDNVSDNGVSKGADGLINAWSLYRIIGYDGDNGYYNSSQGDNCEWGLSSVTDQTSSNKCLNWVNPFSEIYYQAINYLSGNGVIGDYRDNSSSHIDGLPVPQNFEDPLDDDSYCADLYIINLNTSTPSYDYDDLDDSSYKPSRIWDTDDLPGDGDSSAMTDAVGDAEGITGNSYFIGEVDIGSGSDDQQCTAKTITSFGDAGGMCPEEPRLGGSYRIAGLAYYAHVKDIRPESATGNRALEGTQTIETYSVVSSPGTPVIEIPDPNDTSPDPLVTILPACRNQSLSPEGNCALVAFKIVSQEVNSNTNTATGTFYINWEDSEMGGDHDQDMWGILSYTLSADGSLTITTQVHAQSTPYLMGFGYIISGTNDDGFHAHSGIGGFSYTENIAVNTGSPHCADNNGCQDWDAASSKTYSLGSSDTSLLENPLWYAAKYGGFSDSNNDNVPDQTDEWDNEVNSTGESGADGIPDNYFYATDPEELEAALTRVLDAILDRTSSGTSAAVVSSNVDGEGAVYSAYYEPSKTSAADSSNEATWMGTLTALWLDSYGYSRQDCTPPDNDAIDDDGNCEELTECVPNGQLDNYCVDQVVASYYDEGDGATYMHVYNSNSPDSFSSYSMQGVVTAYSSGSVTMVPNSMEGMSEYSDTTLSLTPYELNGTVTDTTGGTVTMSVADGDWTGPSGESFNIWTITSDNSATVGYTTSSISLASGSVSFTLSSLNDWLSAGDSITLTTKNLVGNSGETFEDWTITCLDGTDATGSISSGSQELSNDESTVAVISSESGDFSSCTRAIFYTYDMAGTADTEYSTWEVSNLDNDQTEGTSSSTLALTNDGTLTFSVSPSENWIEAGDRLQVASYSLTNLELDDVGYLWNAREELYLSSLSDDEIAINRDYDSESADEGRYITTWVDDDLDNVVDADEYREFEAAMFSHSTYPVSFTFFDVADKTVAEELVEYIRGVEKTDSRNRTIRYSTNDSEDNVMRLGDIVNSTPTTVSYPLDSYDLLYEDASYSIFKQQYINRRSVIYVGANDGLIHAFNGGFYNEITNDDGEETVQYTTSGTDYEGNDVIEHPLGSELWAYAPMNLLPHLQWLKDKNYADSHVGYMDSKPRVFDANIFDEDADHPDGWGTVMVVGMNLGGGSMTIDVDNDNDASTKTREFQTHSSYVVMDVTNPEVAPVLLGELTPPDKSFSTVYPAVAAFQDTGESTSCGNDDESCNSWYLIFGTGPDDISTVESSQTTKIYLFDLQQLVTGTPSPSAEMDQDDCEIEALTDTYNVISCDTGIAKTYMGTPVTVDWDLDFKANTLYFGLIRDADTTDFDTDKDSDSGRVIRMAFNDDSDHTSWESPITFFNAERPISIYSVPLPAFDDLDNHWLFFGSGRYLSTADKTSTETQSIFGVKDYEDGDYPILNSDLLDVSDAAVYTDGTLQTDITGMGGDDLTTFDEIEDEIDSDNAAGWFLNLPPISGEEGIAPSTRNITSSILYSSVLLSSVFQPSEDPCNGEGSSRLYGLYYKTGTGYADIPILGTSTKTEDGEVKYLTTTSIDLGTGNASAPTITTGSGTDTITAYTQISTGVTVQTEVEAITTPRAGRTSWVDQDF